ncbi:MAG: hypothetical protein HY606_05810 [Planctomycetes bacterium]|nr:hypothetical protein [Planctomycetota bacterium]
MKLVNMTLLFFVISITVNFNHAENSGLNCLFKGNHPKIAWTSDSKTVVYTNDYEIYVYNTETKETTKIFDRKSSEIRLNEKNYDLYPFLLSPDNKWISFATGRGIYGITLDGKETKQLTEKDGIFSWLDNTKIFYVYGDGHIAYTLSFCISTIGNSAEIITTGKKSHIDEMKGDNTYNLTDDISILGISDNGKVIVNYRKSADLAHYVQDKYFIYSIDQTELTPRLIIKYESAHPAVLSPDCTAIAYSRYETLKSETEFKILKHIIVTASINTGKDFGPFIITQGKEANDYDMITTQPKWGNSSTLYFVQDFNLFSINTKDSKITKVTNLKNWDSPRMYDFETGNGNNMVISIINNPWAKPDKWELHTVFDNNAINKISPDSEDHKYKNAIALSPNGRSVAYLIISTDNRTIELRVLDTHVC